MKIFNISRKDSIDYDEVDSFVIVAENENAARELAAKSAAYEGEKIWHDPKTICEEIDLSKECVVCRSFNAG